MNHPVYLDNHATTKVDPRVVDAMVPLLNENYGNAASRQHEFGWQAEAALELARKRIAALVGASPVEVIFTSGATESINLALKGIAQGYRLERDHIITAATEHKAVLDTCRRLAQEGFSVTTVPVDGRGLVDPDDVRRSITSRTLLVSIMTANNEIGTIAPVAAIGALCREHGLLFHTDATQAVGKIPVDMQAMNVDLLSCSAHKLYGPKGVGVLIVRAMRPPVRIVPQIDGGGHERGLRSGTVNVPGVAGFGVAAEIARVEMAGESRRLSELRDRLVGGLIDALGDVCVNGHPAAKLPHNANMMFPGVKADELMMAMKDIAVSSGSACSSASPGPSHVLLAIGLSREQTLSSVRFGLGRFTTDDEIEYTIARVAEVVKMKRQKSRKMSYAH